MTTPNDGGPAFPRPIGSTNAGISETGYPGMSRRDWLAGLAMQGFVSDPQNLIGIRDTAEQAGIEAPAMMALTSYKLADAMIAEGDKPKEE